MKQQRMGARQWGRLLGCLLLCLCLAPPAWAQQTLGTVNVTVVDASGAPVPGALLNLKDLATNDTRSAVSQEAGNYSFVNLTFGQYKLTVSLQGFATQSYDVVVQSARTTDVKATLKVGAWKNPSRCRARPPWWRARATRSTPRLHETDRRSAPRRPQHRATVAVDRRLQRHLERVAIVCAEQLRGRHHRQHQPLALSDPQQRSEHRDHTAYWRTSRRWWLVPIRST